MDDYSFGGSFFVGHMRHYPNRLILGCRHFSSSASEQVPWKSLFGNRCTCFFFRLLFGKRIHDTQTGLRGIPRVVMPEIISLSGERFEYETNMLIQSVKRDYVHLFIICL